MKCRVYLVDREPLGSICSARGDILPLAFATCPLLENVNAACHVFDV